MPQRALIKRMTQSPELTLLNAFKVFYCVNKFHFEKPIDFSVNLWTFEKDPIGSCRLEMI